jgi:regulator of nucleoside diphosphate kinase
MTHMNQRQDQAHNTNTDTDTNQSADWTLSKRDFARLLPLVATPADSAAKSAIEELDCKLASAKLVEPAQIEGDVVTMNSKVLVHCSNWERPREYRLVYPRHGLCETGEVSVASPLGAGLLGLRVGARFALGSQGRSFELVALTYQPEAAGDFQL